MGLKGENVLVGLMKKTMLLCLFSFFVANWATLINAVLDGFVWAGFTGGRLEPRRRRRAHQGSVVHHLAGLRRTQPLETEISSLSL